ncbi:Sds3-like-domain-containing protein, partial [Jimgerdemannia flammicorona]
RTPSGSSKINVGLNGIIGSGGGGAGEGDDDEEGEGWSDETGQEVVESKKDKRRREFTERMQRLNQEFMENKERIYTDKLKAFQSELRAIQDGTQPEFLERLADLEDTRDTMIDQKRLFRNFQLECAGNQYELETKQAEEEYMAEKQGLREKMLAGVEERRKKLKEDKDNLDISNGMPETGRMFRAIVVQSHSVYVFVTHVSFISHSHISLRKCANRHRRCH